MRVNGERVYPVDRKTASWLEQEYRAKLSANVAEGLEQFALGCPRRFGGYDLEGLRRTHAVAVVYDPRSKGEFIERVSHPLLDLSAAYGIPAIASGVGEKPDLSPHTTIEVGRISPDFSDEQAEHIMKWMDSSYSHIRPIANILNGLQFRHNRLVMAPNAYTCDSTPDLGQGVAIRTRRLILKTMTDALRQVIGPDEDRKKFTEPYRYNNLFHSSAWRLVQADDSQGLTEPIAAERFIAFAQEANAIIGKSLVNKPMLLRVGSVRIGAAHEFIIEDAPHLINAS